MSRPRSSPSSRENLRNRCGLLVDDSEELVRLGGIQARIGAQCAGRGALDGGQRHTQLVAHHAEELSAQPFQLFQGRHVLYRGNDGHDFAFCRADRSRVDDRGDSPSVREVDDQFLGPHGLAGANRPRSRELIGWNLAPVQTPEGHHTEEFRLSMSRRVQPDVLAKSVVEMLKLEHVAWIAVYNHRVSKPPK